uniref:Uncharacterized protein n=1 Tax=Pseudomonas savastanoi pv. glycinea TaxID=318 RepID=I7H0G4_PSESG|nr:hypothetical protein [Pseudomonas savastanoi pv. glycinea]
MWSVSGGPRRFGKLRVDIPGISANILSCGLMRWRRKVLLFGMCWLSRCLGLRTVFRRWGWNCCKRVSETKRSELRGECHDMATDGLSSETRLR